LKYKISDVSLQFKAQDETLRFTCRETSSTLQCIYCYRLDVGYAVINVSFHNGLRRRDSFWRLVSDSDCITSYTAARDQF